MKFVQVLTTTPDKETAEKIAKTLVENKLAACVQIYGPVTSVYRWKDKIEQEVEWQCQIKTCDKLTDKIENLIKDAHPYDVPEIIVTEIVSGSNEYLNWIKEMVAIG